MPTAGFEPAIPANELGGRPLPQTMRPLGTADQCTMNKYFALPNLKKTFYLCVHDEKLHCKKIHTVTELRIDKSSSECVRRSL